MLPETFSCWQTASSVLLTKTAQELGDSNLTLIASAYSLPIDSGRLSGNCLSKGYNALIASIVVFQVSPRYFRLVTRLVCIKVGSKHSGHWRRFHLIRFMSLVPP